MAKQNKAVVLLLLLLLLAYGCNKQKAATKSLDEVRTGSEGIVVNFLPNAPPQTIHAEESADNSFDVVMEIRNKGAYPQPDEASGSDVQGSFGNVYLSGYDTNILTFGAEGGNSNALSASALEGKSAINPNGGHDIMSLKGTINIDNLNVEKYETTLAATACYKYGTVLGPAVCIDPNPYSSINEKKVCNVQDIALTSQGAPVAVTKIDEEALAAKTQFKITIKNVGNGNVLTFSAFGKCDPLGNQKIEREDIDKVFVDEVRIGSYALECGPFYEVAKSQAGHIRLINNEGYIICDLPESEYGQTNTAYTTPLKIKLSYVYRSTAERKLQIIREAAIGDAVGISSKEPKEDLSLPGRLKN